MNRDVFSDEIMDVQAKVLSYALPIEDPREFVEELWQDPDRRHTYNERVFALVKCSEAFQKIEAQSDADSTMRGLVEAGEQDEEYLSLRLLALYKAADEDDEMNRLFLEASTQALLSCAMDYLQIPYTS